MAEKPQQSDSVVVADAETPLQLESNVQALLDALTSAPTPEDAEVTKPTPTRKPKVETKPPVGEGEQPAWMTPFMSTVQQMQTDYRTLQGQIRSLESRLQGQPHPRQQQRPVEPELDLSDPNVAALARGLNALTSHVEQLQGMVQGSAETTAELEFRNEWLGYLENTAEKFGVPWGEVEASLRRIPTRELATRGMETVAAIAKTKSTSPQSGDAGGGFEDGRKQGMRDALKALNIDYEQIRNLPGAISDDTIDQKLQGLLRFNREPGSVEELAKLTKGL